MNKWFYIAIAILAYFILRRLIAGSKKTTPRNPQHLKEDQPKMNIEAETIDFEEVKEEKKD